MIAAPPPVYPWPIGHGPRYQPAATAPGGRPVGRLRCGTAGGGFLVHVELFARRQVVVVPAGIGRAAAGCAYPVSTERPTGVVRVLGPGRMLGDLFRVWGRRLTPRGLLSFRGVVSVYVNGRRRSGDPRGVALRPHDEIVVEVGGYVAPHVDYLFPRGEG